MPGKGGRGPWAGVEGRGSVSLNPVPLLQVLCSSSHGPHCQFWDPQVGPGEDRQWHPAGDPLVCPRRVPGEDGIPRTENA